MKDFITKATFGFIMAQLFPGAVAVFCGSFLYLTITSPQPDSFPTAARELLRNWALLSGTGQLFLVGICIGTGMLIHGLHWSVMGYYESSAAKSVFDSFWHKRRLFLQVLGGPVKLVLEVFALLVKTPDIRGATVEENVPNIHKDLWPHFEFLQEFYLYSAQFFAHTALALIIGLSAMVGFIAWNGFTEERLLIAIFLYLLCGLFFVLGRMQFRTLFYAEGQLVDRSRGLNDQGEQDARKRISSISSS